MSRQLAAILALLAIVVALMLPMVLFGGCTAARMDEIAGRRRPPSPPPDMAAPVPHPKPRRGDARAGLELPTS